MNRERQIDEFLGAGSELRWSNGRMDKWMER